MKQHIRDWRAWIAFIIAAIVAYIAVTNYAAWLVANAREQDRRLIPPAVPTEKMP